MYLFSNIRKNEVDVTLKCFFVITARFQTQRSLFITLYFLSAFIVTWLKNNRLFFGILKVKLMLKIFFPFYNYAFFIRTANAWIKSSDGETSEALIVIPNPLIQREESLAKRLMQSAAKYFLNQIYSIKKSIF